MYTDFIVYLKIYVSRNNYNIGNTIKHAIKINPIAAILNYERCDLKFSPSSNLLSFFSPSVFSQSEHLSSEWYSQFVFLLQV